MSPYRTPMRGARMIAQYTPRTINNLSRVYLRRYNAPLRAAGMAYRYGPQVVRAARAANKIRQAWNRHKAKRKSKRKFSRRHIGQDIGTSSSKKAAVTLASFTRSTRELYLQELTLFPKQTGIDEINRRERDVIAVSGFRICLQFANSLQQPMYLNVAVVHKKDNGVPDPDSFFRGTGDNSREENFNVSLSGLAFHCLPINTDLYTVMRHKRYRMNSRNNPVATDNTFQYGASILTIDWWIKMRRQLRFDGSNLSPQDGTVYLVYWADIMTATSGTTSTTAAYELQTHIVKYFREPQAVFK